MRNTAFSTVFALTLCLAATPSPARGDGPDANDVVRNSENTLRLAEGASRPAARIDALAWLAGYWTGTGLGGATEEMWTPPVGDRMHGVFTLRQDGQVRFTETMMLVEQEQTVVLRLKHFDADFVGWEDKHDTVDFRLVKLGEREAFFDGLTFRLEGEDRLRIFLVLQRGDERSEHSFTMERGDL